METIESISRKIHDELMTYPEVKEYFRLKKLIEESNELSDLKKQIENSCKTNKKQFENFKKKYDSHPLIINYNQIKEEVLSLLNEIKGQIK